MNASVCKTCKWWRDKGDNWDGSGECRRFPPTTTGKHPRGGIVAEWPQTTKHDWCGEHQPKSD